MSGSEGANVLMGVHEGSRKKGRKREMKMETDKKVIDSIVNKKICQNFCLGEREGKYYVIFSHITLPYTVLTVVSHRQENHMLDTAKNQKRGGLSLKSARTTS